MATLILAKLQNGVIFGDIVNQEYIYLPAGECGSDRAIPVYERQGSKEDISLAEAVNLITRRSLRPVVHPLLGKSTF